MSVYDLTVPLFLRGLDSALHIIDKAEEFAKQKNIDLAEVAEWKLIDDMKPFTFQIINICNTPKMMVTRVGQIENLRSWPDDEKTIEELRERIKATQELLSNVDKSAFDGKEKVSFEFFGTKVTALQYVQLYSIPNFFFHLTTAYDILRMKGVDIGKKDYIGGSNPVLNRI